MILKDKELRTLALLPLLLALMIAAAAAQPLAAAPVQDDTLILADATDPYYSLAEEVAQSEALPIVHTLDEAMEQSPSFLLWVVSPGRLSDQALIDFGLALRGQPSAISVGIVSGSTMEEARELWQRASQVQAERIFAVNTANSPGHIEAQITAFGEAETSTQPLSMASFTQSLQRADYLTFTGHGGSTYLALEKGNSLRAGDIPPLRAALITTASCNTFRPWESGSLPLAFVSQGAAGYAGFTYSPNGGYLIGAYQGVPFRYTWPEFPIGHVVQIQNRSTRQGFAHFPYYWLLGDPRIALQAEAPYRLMEDQTAGDTRTLTYADAPPGFIPVRIPGGARYSFVEIPGVSAAWEHGPFYNSRLQMMNMQDDKFVLFAHPGGDFTLRLRTRPSWAWVASDVLTDALDNALVYLPQTGDQVVTFVAVGIALLVVVWLLLRQKAAATALLPAALIGLGFAVLHGLYIVARLDQVTITSKLVQFNSPALVSTFLLVSCGTFFFLNARAWWGRAISVLVASLGALAPAVFLLGVLGLGNLAFSIPRLGTSLYNYNLALQPLITFAIEVVLFSLIFEALRAMLRQRWSILGSYDPIS